MASTVGQQHEDRAARTGSTTSPVAGRGTARRNVAWLAGGIVMSFVVPFVLADQLGLQRDLYYGIYMAAVTSLFVGWARDTGHPLREMCARHWRWAVGLGLIVAGLSAAIVLGAEDATSHPGGIQFATAIAWRGILYGAADGVLLSAKLRKPVTGDLVWSVPTLATMNPIGAPLAHAGLHVAAVTHSYDTDLFLPPH